MFVQDVNKNLVSLENNVSIKPFYQKDEDNYVIRLYRNNGSTILSKNIDTKEEAMEIMKQIKYSLYKRGLCIDLGIPTGVED